MQIFNSNTLSNFKITAISPFEGVQAQQPLCCGSGTTLKYLAKSSLGKPDLAMAVAGGRWAFQCVMRSDLDWCVFLHLQLNKWYCEDLTVHVCDDPLLHKDLFVCILT